MKDADLVLFWVLWFCLVIFLAGINYKLAKILAKLNELLEDKDND